MVMRKTGGLSVLTFRLSFFFFGCTLVLIYFLILWCHPFPWFSGILKHLSAGYFGAYVQHSNDDDLIDSYDGNAWIVNKLIIHS